MKKIFKTLCALIIALVIIVGIYAAYACIVYYRVEDMQSLEVQGEGTQAETGVAYRAVSFNIGFGAYSDDFGFFMDGGKNARGYSADSVGTNTAGMIATSLYQDADIYLYQEVDMEGDRSRDVDQVAMIREAFPESSSVFAQNYDSPYLFYPFHEPIGSAVSGLLTVSDFGITSSVRRSLPIESGFMKFVDLDRCYSVSRVPVANGRELIIYNVHLTAYTNDANIVTNQVKMLCNDMAAEYAKGNYIICGGDFNCDLPGNSYELFEVSGDYNWNKPFDRSLLPEGMVLVPPVAAENPVPTARRADGPYVPGKSYVTVLDGFIVSDNISVIQTYVVDAGFKYSDHNPVVLDFELLD